MVGREQPLCTLHMQAKAALLKTGNGSRESGSINKTGGLQSAVLSCSGCIIRPQARRWMGRSEAAQAQQRSMLHHSSAVGCISLRRPLVMGITYLLGLGGLWRPRVLPGWGPSVMTPGGVLGQPSSVQRSDVWAVKMVGTTIPCHLTAWLGTWGVLATGVCLSLSWRELTRGGRNP